MSFFCRWSVHCTKEVSDYMEYSTSVLTLKGGQGCLVAPLSGVSGLSFDSPFLSPLLFFCLVLLLLSRRVIFLPMVHSLHERSIRLHGVQCFSRVECFHALPLQKVVSSSGPCLLTGFFLLPTCDNPLMLGPVISSLPPPHPPSRLHWSRCTRKKENLHEQVCHSL